MKGIKGRPLEISETEVEEIVMRYKKLSPINRVFIVSASSLLLASQEAEKEIESEAV